MLLRRDQLAELLHLEQFAFDHLLRQFDQRVQNAEIALLHRDLERLHVKPIAGQHAHRVAPLRVGGGTAAPELGFVNNVVVDKRRGVDDLDNRRELYRAIALVAEKLRGEEQQRWTDSLSPTGAQVLANLRDRRDVRNRIATELLFDGDNVVTEEVEDFFPVDGGRRAQCLQLLR